jgi:DNA-binding transcriptional regulator/RsmH inhibitor MraZ
MFYGKHEHTVDDKNRLTLPAKFRDALSGGSLAVGSIGTSMFIHVGAGMRASRGSRSWTRSRARLAR